MNKLTAIIGTLLLSLTAAAGSSDLQIFNTFTAAGVTTDLSVSSKSQILLIDSVQCRDTSDPIECLVSDASKHGFQRTISGEHAKLVLKILTSVIRTPPFYETTESNKLYAVRGLRCVQSKKEGSTLDEQTSCYAKLARAEHHDLYWGNPLDLQKLLSEE